MVKKRKQNISNAERARRRRQALINFGKRRKSSATKLKGGRKVARRKARRTSSRRSSMLMKPLAVLVAGGAYGALREKVSNVIAPLTSKIPIAGNISDEIGMFGLSYLIHKNMKSKQAKMIALAGMLVESARIGDGVVSGQVNLNLASNNGVGSGGFPTFG